MKIFFHTDLDGKCAGAIVYHYFKDRPITTTSKYTTSEVKSTPSSTSSMTSSSSKDAQIECIPINYNHDFPFDTIKENEQIYIVDFSLQKEGDFEKLLEITPNVVWIDHHKTAIEKHASIAHRIAGLRDTSKSGCELTWKHFYPERTTPKIVELLGDYDTWTFKYGEKTNYLQNGIRLYGTNPQSLYWPDWFRGDHLYGMIEKGKICIGYRDNYYAGLIKSWSFPVEFEGYKCIACNAGSASSELFDSIEEDYDIMMPFVYDGKQWTISLHTKKDIDVSEIAKKYGGGGHKQASGFQVKALPWK